MTTLHGRIEEGVLANLLQYLSLSQSSGCLLLRHPQSRQGYVYFEHGRIVFVEAKPSYDLAALAALLRWRDGQFSFRPGVRSPRITLERSTEMLLLEAAHMADEVHERSEAAGPRLDADTVLSALAESVVGRGAQTSTAADPGSPSGGWPEEESVAPMPVMRTPPDSPPRGPVEPDSQTTAERAGPRTSQDSGGRFGRSGRGSRGGRSDHGSVRARAYAVMLPDVRAAAEAAAGAAVVDERDGVDLRDVVDLRDGVEERHGDDPGLAVAGAGARVTLGHAPADHGAEAAVAESRPSATRGAAMAVDAPPETVALSLSALLLYRRLDGLRSLREHAADLDREPTEMVRAGRELLDARLAEYVTLVVADPRFVVELAREAVDLLGPVGEIVVEDALYDLGLSGDTLPVSSVDELIQELSGAFKNAFTRADFLRRVTELRRLFALEPVAPGRTR